MKNQREKNLKQQDGYIHFRISKRMKNSLQRQANKQGKSLSDYIRYLIKEGKKKEKIKKELAQCIVLCQDIVEYVQEKYDCSENEILEEMVEKLWEKLSL